MEEELKNEAIKAMDKLGHKSRSTMGLHSEEEIAFDILVWLFAGGEKPDVIEDIESN